jgi:hypothetical protein
MRMAMRAGAAVSVVMLAAPLRRTVLACPTRPGT